MKMDISEDCLFFSPEAKHCTKSRMFDNTCIIYVLSGEKMAKRNETKREHSMKKDKSNDEQKY